MPRRDVLNGTMASFREYAGLPEADPLRESDALQEAQLLDVRLDAVRGQVALLFELRMALQLREPNTGVLVARGVREFGWTAPSRSTQRTAWGVGNWRLIIHNRLPASEREGSAGTGSCERRSRALAAGGQSAGGVGECVSARVWPA